MQKNDKKILLTVIFIYNVVAIKSDFTRFFNPKKHRFILIGSDYCLKLIKPHNIACFSHIHQIKRDFLSPDFKEVEALVSQYLENTPVESIRLFTDEDSAQITCAKLREKYGIPGDHVKDVLPFVDKGESKKILCKNKSIELPNFTIFDRNSYAKNAKNYVDKIANEIGFPLIIKPTRLVSSINTFRIDNLTQLKRCLQKLSKNSLEFEIDEFILGTLYHCDGLMWEGKYLFSSVSRCSLPLLKFLSGNPIGSICIDPKSEQFKMLEKSAKQILKQLNMQTGLFHIEFFLTPDNRVIFLEAAKRSGGALIKESHEKMYGINIQEWFFQLSLNPNVKMKKQAIVNYSAMVIYPVAQGEVIKVKKPNIKTDYLYTPLIQPGAIIKNPPKNLLDYSAHILIWDKSCQKIEETFRKLQDFRPLVVKK